MIPGGFRDLAEHIRLGALLVPEGELYTAYPIPGYMGRCALGTAAEAAGIKLEYTYTWRTPEFTKRFPCLMIPWSTTSELGPWNNYGSRISCIHYQKKKTRLEIADWLDTLEPEKPEQPQSAQPELAAQEVAS